MLLFASNDFFFGFVCFAGLLARAPTFICGGIDCFAVMYGLGDGIMLSDFGKLSTETDGKSGYKPCDNRGTFGFFCFAGLSPAERLCFGCAGFCILKLGADICGRTEVSFVGLGVIEMLGVIVS